MGIYPFPPKNTEKQHSAQDFYPILVVSKKKTSKTKTHRTVTQTFPQTLFFFNLHRNKNGSKPSITHPQIPTLLQFHKVFSQTHFAFHPNSCKPNSD